MTPPPSLKGPYIDAIFKKCFSITIAVKQTNLAHVNNRQQSPYKCEIYGPGQGQGLLC